MTTDDADPSTTAHDTATTSTAKETTIINTTPKDSIPATTTITTVSTTESSVDEPTTEDKTATTQTVMEEKDVVPVQISESKLALILSAIALGVSLIHLLGTLVSKMLCCACKKDTKKLKSKKDEVSKMNEFTMQINPARTFHTYTSPIYNPYFSEEKDDSYAL